MVCVCVFLSLGSSLLLVIVYFENVKSMYFGTQSKMHNLFSSHNDDFFRFCSVQPNIPIVNSCVACASPHTLIDRFIGIFFLF